jgi:hypothetical protein
MKMTMRVTVSAVLLISAISVRAQETGQPAGESGMSVDADTANAQNDSAAVEATSEEARKIIAYYFHSTRRCASCRKIESYSAEIIRAAFEGELDQGLLEWRLVNTDESENKHFIKDYELYTKSLVLSDIVNGEQIRWKNLDKIWVLLKDKESFQEYIRDEVRAFLEEN